MEMKILVGVLVGAVFLVTPGTCDNGQKKHHLFEKEIEAAFENGYNQIMALNVPRACRNSALNTLTLAKEENQNMTCDSAKAIALDVLSILNVAFDSSSSLIVDLNTVVNGIPLCFSEHSWYNIPGIGACIVGQAKSIWYAIIDFWHWNQFYEPSIKATTAFYDCLTKKNHAKDSVQKIVKSAMLCR